MEFRKRARSKPVLGFLMMGLCLLEAASAQTNERFLIVSWGDVIYGREGVSKLDTSEKMRQAIEGWRARGVDKVLFRVDDFRVLLFHDVYVDPNIPYLREWARISRRAWEEGLVDTAVKVLKQAGIEAYMWITITDEGAPPEVLFNYGKGLSFRAWQSRFTRENTHVLVCDRSLTPNQRQFQWGVMEYAYPEVRRYMLQTIRAFSDKFPFDGVFLSLRSHSPPPRHADQFGFNEPVVREFKKRYGRDILRQDFDLDQWRELRGEYLTTFLQEVESHLETTGQKLAVGVQQGEYIGPPFGNMRIQWRRWVSEKIIDELFVGHITRVRSRYPNRAQRGWGYLQNQEEGLGLPPIEEALRRDYGPLCRKHGVKLYVEPGNFYRHHKQPAYGSGAQPPEVGKKLVAEILTIPGVTGIPVRYDDVTESDGKE